MSHYAIFKREVYELIPKYEQRVRVANSSTLDFYERIYDVENKFEGVVDTEIFAGRSERYLVNCIVHNLQKKENVVFWEGELGLNELQVGDNITIEEETFKISSVIKNVEGSITYGIDNKYIKAHNYNDLYRECEEQYNNNCKIIINELNNKSVKIKEDKKSLWSRIFG